MKRKLRSFLTSFLILISSICSLFGQNSDGFSIIPLKANDQLKYWSINPSNNFSNSAASLQLPFVDDFSYQGPFAASDKWEVYKKVFVNYNFVKAAPTIGAALFDGLDENANPYPANPVSTTNAASECDILTSKPLNLVGYSNVYLNFWVAQKGIVEPFSGGYYPKKNTNPNLGAVYSENFIIQFRKNNGDWVNVKTIEPYTETELITGGKGAFETQDIVINQAEYLYDGFQFRFKCLSNRRDFWTQWFLDLVRLDYNPLFNNIKDVGFQTLPSPILSKYGSMPWRQFSDFKNQELYGIDLAAEKENISIKNLYNQVIGITQNSRLIRITGSDNVDYYNNPFGDITNLNVPANGNIILNDDLNSTKRAQMIQTLSTNVPITTNHFELKKTYELNTLSNDLVNTNNIVGRKTIFDNYFAYDDATAEVASTLRGEDVVGIIEFKTNLADKFYGIAIPFDASAPQSSFEKKYNLGIWFDKEQPTGAPNKMYNDIVVKPSTTGGYTFFLFKNGKNLEPISVTAGKKIHIGWGPSADTRSTRPNDDIYIKTDYTTDCTNFTYIKKPMNANAIGIPNSTLGAPLNSSIFNLGTAAHGGKGGTPMIRLLSGYNPASYDKLFTGLNINYTTDIPTICNSGSVIVNFDVQKNISSGDLNCDDLVELEIYVDNNPKETLLLTKDVNGAYKGSKVFTLSGVGIKNFVVYANGTCLVGRKEFSYEVIGGMVNENKLICNNTTTLAINSGIYKYKTITSGGTNCAGIVKANSNVKFFHGQNVQLLPGFSVELGSVFEAKGNPDVNCLFNPQDEVFFLKQNKPRNTEGVKFEAYPNPVTNELVVQYSIEDTANDEQTVLGNINIINTTGQIIKQVPVKSNQAEETIDVSNMPSGIFFCQLKIGNRTINKKIIKID